MTQQRKPAAFRVEPTPISGAEAQEEERRKPRSAKLKDAVVIPAENDVFEQPEIAAAEPPPISVPRRRSRIAAIFLAALGTLVSLALGLWLEALIRDLFSRADWLGWVAVGLAIVAAFAFVVILARELVGLARLNSVERLRIRGADAVARNDSRAAKQVVHELTRFVATRPETAAGRRSLAAHSGDIIDGADLVRLAEADLLAPLDERAQVLILDAAKRVSIVTAISPRALVDVAYVLYEAGKLIRLLADLYGGRPGTLGLIRLFRDVLAHLAVTGAMAAGDEFVHQVLGQGLAARLSARLGEGVVNGMMTARIGVAAMETVRPLPFVARNRPGMGDFLAALTRFAKRGSKRNSADDV